MVKSRFKGNCARIIVLLLAAVLLAACSSAPVATNSRQRALLSAVERPASGAEVALLSDEEQLYNGFMAEAWNTISRFAGETGLTSGVYNVGGSSPENIEASVELAVKGGARLVVAVGEAMAQSAGKAAQSHEEVQFLLLDSGSETATGNNVMAVRYAAEQGGWLAGYLAVKAGLRTLALDGTAQRQARQYAVGFAAGADAAAGEQPDGGPVRLFVLPALGTQDEAARQQLGARLGEAYEQEDGLLFANDAGAQQQALEVAQHSGGQLLAASDELALSATVVGVLQKSARTYLYDLLQSWHQHGGTPAGGRVCGVAEGGFAMPVEGFGSLTDEQYRQAMGLFEDGTLAKQLAALADGGEGQLPDVLATPTAHVQLLPLGGGTSSEGSR